jgi:serine/threonine protein kinase
MPLSVGDKLGPSEILAPIGTGGMGEVYQARDPRLAQDVAIKVLPAEECPAIRLKARHARGSELFAILYVLLPQHAHEFEELRTVV